ncbi:hypothetical protein Emag_000036 [Eimeria magna]
MGQQESAHAAEGRPRQQAAASAAIVACPSSCGLLAAASAVACVKEVVRTPSASSSSSRNSSRNSSSREWSKGDKLAATPGMFVQHSTAAFSDRYKGQRVLGKGSFGEVILCKDKVTGQATAIHQPFSLSLQQQQQQQQQQQDRLGCLSAAFHIEVDAARIIRQVLSGITYMHKNKVVHRDLKPENLLLENKRKDANIRIIDFGLSTHFESTKKMKDKIGTAYYIAPEVLHGTYDEKCDVWSTGVILYILLSGCPPFNGANEFEILKKVEKGKYTFDLPQWKKVSEPAKDLIRKMLTYVPTMRITARDALEHDWLKTADAAAESIDVPSLESTILNIRQFQGTQKLAQAALLYMGSKLTSNEETKELNKIFQKMDKNGDGQLDKQELMEGYVELMKLKGEDVSALDQSAIEYEVDQVLDAVDFDKNGFIEYSEFVTVAMDRKTLLSRQRLERAFRMFDSDGSGKISSSELATIFGVSELDSESWRGVLSEVDKNNDGEVDFEEFQQMLLKLCSDS